jgi:hypothetical protein
VKKSSIALLLLAASSYALGQQVENHIGSFLYEPAYRMDRVLRGEAKAYLPQPGDVMLATDKNLFWKVTHDLALAFEPHNSAVVVARRDGTLATLEAGPNDTLRCTMLDLLPHLKEYSDKGPVWIRKRKTPITAEQSAALTDFAERQNGKRFAIGRLGIQLTPFRQRGPIRTAFLASPVGDRRSYFCSELVLEALAAANLVDPVTTRPAASYPHDLFFDRALNPYINRHPPLACAYDPPARWVSCK